jgi:hypothetical protein
MALWQFYTRDDAAACGMMSDKRFGGPQQRKRFMATIITKEDMVGMFADMKANAPWDSSKPLMWGYFFADPSEEKLKQAVPLLKAKGYAFVGIYPSNKEQPDDPDLWWLQVEKAEKHTVDSLHLRNQEFYRFIEEQQIESYDGMDVGPVS